MGEMSQDSLQDYSIPQNWLKILGSKLYRKSKTQGRYAGVFSPA